MPRTQESRSPDWWIFLGDYITDARIPHRTVEFRGIFSESHPCVFILRQPRGLQSSASGLRRSRVYGSKSGALLYTFENVTDSDLDWLAGMPISRRVELPGAEPFMICHGSPDSINYLFHTNTREAEEMISRLGEYNCRLLLCGHSHIPFIFRRGGRMLVNPGALGMPVNSQTAAQYAMIDYDGEFHPEIISVEYDIERTAAEFAESGLLAKSAVWGRGLVATIRTGVNYTVHAVRLVERLAQKTGLPVTDESLWERAAKELRIP